MIQVDVVDLSGCFLVATGEMAGTYLWRMPGHFRASDGSRSTEIHYIHLSSAASRSQAKLFRIARGQVPGILAANADLTITSKPQKPREGEAAGSTATIG